MVCGDDEQDGERTAIWQQALELTDAESLIEVADRLHRDDRCYAGVRLRQVDLSGLDLTGADLRDAILLGCRLVGTQLGGALMVGARLFDCVIDDACLAGANMEGAVLYRVIGTEVDLDDANLARATMHACMLTAASLARATMRGVRSIGCILRRCDLAEADLTAAALHGADLSDARLCRATLVDADLSHATLVGADMAGAVIERTDFLGALLVPPKIEDQLALADVRSVRCRDLEYGPGDLVNLPIIGHMLSARDAEVEFLRSRIAELEQLWLRHRDRELLQIDRREELLDAFDCTLDRIVDADRADRAREQEQAEEAFRASQRDRRGRATPPKGPQAPVPVFASACLVKWKEYQASRASLPGLLAEIANNIDWDGFAPPRSAEVVAVDVIERGRKRVGAPGNQRSEPDGEVIVRYAEGPPELISLGRLQKALSVARKRLRRESSGD